MLSAVAFSHLGLPLPRRLMASGEGGQMDLLGRESGAQALGEGDAE